MTDEEKVLRAKFYLAPKTVSLDDLRKMNEKYTAYPGATQEQALEIYEKILKFKSNLDHDGVKVIKNI